MQMIYVGVDLFYGCTDGELYDTLAKCNNKKRF